MKLYDGLDSEALPRIFRRVPHPYHYTSATDDDPQNIRQAKTVKIGTERESKISKILTKSYSYC